MVTVSDGYPSDIDPNARIQVHTLMRAFDGLGVKPLVVAPEKRLSLTRIYTSLRRPPRRGKYEGIAVVRPRYIPFSSKMAPVLGSTYRWTVESFRRAVSKARAEIDSNPELVYGHFLMPGGVGAWDLAESFNAKAVVALGESSFDRYESHFGLDAVKKVLSRFWRIVAVSETIRQRCIGRYAVEGNRIKSFPNEVDKNRFYPKPKDQMRRKLGLPPDRVIVVFVGAFDENKGPHRILQAIQGRPDIGAVFLGSGPLKLRGQQVLAAHPAPHEQVPEWLSAADVYVQPVLNEGSSNSMKEASACGLPVITSDIPANREILDESHASLIDPANIDQLRREIERVADDPELRRSMGDAALIESKRSNITHRASRILEWLELT